MGYRPTCWIAAYLSVLALGLPSPALGQQPHPPDDAADLELPRERDLACAILLEASWDQLTEGDQEQAARTLQQARTYYPCDRVSAEVEWAYLSGRTALLAGDPTTAITELDRARSSPSAAVGERPSQAEILYYLGLAHQVAGQPEEARSWYLQLVARYPADTRVALLLPFLPQAAAVTPQQRLDAALHAVQSHNYSAAERFLQAILAQALGRPVEPHDPEFQEVLAATLQDGDRILGEAIYQLGYLWYYWLRAKNDQAPPLLAAVAHSDHPRRADASYFLARSYMRSEEYEAALDTWNRFAQRFPRDNRLHEAIYYSGWLYLDREQFERSLPGLEAYLERFPRGERADRAQWYVGWANFRLGRFAEARRVFHRMAGRGGYLLGAKGQYWEARCFLEEGSSEQAEQTFRSVADRYAFTYYGLLARQRLGEPLVPPREHTPPLSPISRLEELARSDRRLATLSGLLERNLVHRARRFYDARNLGRRPTDRLDQLLVRQAAGDAYRGWREARREAGGSLRRPPTSRTLRDWVVSYPRPFTRSVVAAAAEFDLDPLWIWSHMQIESHYNHTFVSYADAMGLMQIIPKTGQLIAEALGEPYAEGMLMDPVVNLRYAAWYLRALEEEFSGQLPLAITAYNSGAYSMQRWVDQNADLEFDAFIEEIPYDQSREYVKRVIGIYVHYLYLYADDQTLESTVARLLPARIEPSYRRQVTW
ncbi:MAG: transglycosylase SLT domain-containing protein [Bradymonadales bacterium]|nr:transglycosylase SLT domain-containing protein [Bradymonadales bacterium]